MAGMPLPHAKEPATPPPSVPPPSRAIAPPRPSTTATGTIAPRPPLGAAVATKRKVNRREFMRTIVAASVLLAVGATGAYEIVTKLGPTQASQAPTIPPLQQETTTSSSSTTIGESSLGSSYVSTTATSISSSTQVPAGYALVAQLSSLGSKTSAYFTHPKYGNSILINLGSQWKAFSAVCTHRPCTVDLSGSTIYCPCHGATFSTDNGAVLGGPAPTPLAEYGVLVQNGSLYVSTSRVN